MGINETGRADLSEYSRDIDTYNKIKRYDRRKLIPQKKGQMLYGYKHHSEITTRGSTIEEILAKLEEKANLPADDLYIKNLDNPSSEKVGIYRVLKFYDVGSKTVDNGWTNDIDKYINSKGKMKLGYVNASIMVTEDSRKLLDDMSRFVDYLTDSKTPADGSNGMPKIIGSMFTSENCSGRVVYDSKAKYVRCKYCGETVEGYNPEK